jgi:outer membrane protein OmpA-like peptidoglycan-associated protein
MLLKINARVLGIAIAALLGFGSVYAAIIVLQGEDLTFHGSRQASTRDGAAQTAAAAGKSARSGTGSATREADRAIAALTDSLPAPGGQPDRAGSPLAFDVARISPGEPSVLAGRAGAGQAVDVLADGVVVGSATADQNGNWVLVIERWPARPDAKLELRPGMPRLAGREPMASQPTAARTRLAAARDTRTDGDGQSAVSAANADMMRQLDSLISQARQSPKGSNEVVDRVIDAAGRPMAAGSAADEQTADRPSTRIAAVAGVPAQSAHTVVPLPIQFEFQAAEFTPYGRQAAGKLLEYLKVSGRQAVSLSGHADDRGSEAYNMELSRKRLQTVEAFLRAGGYEGDLKLIPMGKSEPFRGVDRSRLSREELFQLDRRVELHIRQ